MDQMINDDMRLLVYSDGKRSRDKTKQCKQKTKCRFMIRVTMRSNFKAATARAVAVATTITTPSQYNDNFSPLSTHNFRHSAYSTAHTPPIYQQKKKHILLSIFFSFCFSSFFHRFPFHIIVLGAWCLAGLSIIQCTTAVHSQLICIFFFINHINI